MNKVAIYGGLGNQMFQYALCVALNQRGIKSRISFSNFLYSYPHGGFSLCKAFKIKLQFPLNLMNFFLLNFEFIYKNRFAGFFLRRLIHKYHDCQHAIYKEKIEFEIDENVFNQRSSFLIGIWQVEAYFKDIKNILLKEFAFRMPEDEKNIELIEKIKQSNSVSIHIRRGDYLSDHWQKILGVIKGTAYYKNAIDHINKKIREPFYFVFSDDSNWVKENLRLGNCIYVDHNTGNNSYIDMYLMSLCKHNIIANSTFSWWAAWLNENENKIVLIPERWINGKSCEGIFPISWIKIKVDE
jgi:hypothetical protein